jgi:hypothetical protein
MRPRTPLRAAGSRRDVRTTIAPAAWVSRTLPFDVVSKQPQSMT